ncbi:MAG: hypothetical protein ACKOSS_07635 [Planctomycetia bacterium]
MAARSTGTRSKGSTRGSSTAPRTPAPSPAAAPDDFLARVAALQATLAPVLREPPREALRRAIHDGWRTHVAPRAGSIGATLAALRSARAWRLGDEDRALGLSEAGWSQHARTLARLHATLAGAQDGYARARVRWQEPTRFGIHKVSSAPIVRVGEHAKERERQEKAAADLRKRLDERHGTALEDVLKDWRTRQAGLQQALEALRDLVADLCAAEERLLAPRAGTTAASLAALTALREARIDLAHFAGSPASRFGTLLTRWLAARARLAATAR